MTSQHTYTIVAGVDGSASSAAALDWAIWHAKQTDGRIVAVRAWDMPGLTIADIPGPEHYAEQVSAMLSETINVVAPDSSVEISNEVVQGQPVEALLHAAERVDADLLVVGNRGHGGFAGALLGSVSQQLVHHARCPVVIMREKDHGSH